MKITVVGVILVVAIVGAGVLLVLALNQNTVGPQVQQNGFRQSPGQSGTALG